MAADLDVTDWAVLDELQQDGRVPLAELARRVHLSASALTERVRRLETMGVVTGYRAEVDLEKVGLPLLAVIRLKHADGGHEQLQQLLRNRREVLECLRTTGDDCYMIKVAVASMPGLQRFVDDIARFGATSTSLVYGQTLPYRGPQRPHEPPAAAQPGGASTCDNAAP